MLNYMGSFEKSVSECVNCGNNMRIIALIDHIDVIERSLKHHTETRATANPYLPRPEDEAIALTYHSVPDIA